MITAAAASPRMDSGSARASGSTARELRVAELNATARAAGAASPNSRALKAPRVGASSTKLARSRAPTKRRSAKAWRSSRKGICRDIAYINVKRSRLRGISARRCRGDVP
ncbi:hypothetical protein PCA10_23010 [Metapseudomonas resinovorans NBRC 106553]|uniref:Uncharacterized protein n=1 Tax=Metapseudomonas resinovorans NBRC 106553 TaxID=1245471 RepID=S6AQL0_METRE|nr:hypothetical protein PCA10_23010 [Pseudomonas resinovorans NBRC 106553]